MNASQRYYVPGYSYKAGDVCYCPSGKDFSDCCGSTAADRPPPVHICVVNNFISPQECKKTLRYLEKQTRTWLKVFRAGESGKSKQVMDKDRKTQAVDIRSKQLMFNDWVNRALLEHVEPTTGGRIEWFEIPYILRYGPNGFYNKHADAEVFDIDAKRWYRVMDRDVSLLIYLNDDFTGGELHFPSLNYTYQPKQGDLVFFPSNHLFIHESQPLKTGKKYAMVSWSVMQGSPRAVANNIIPRAAPVRQY